MPVFLPRLLTLPHEHHFFLFGARNTGKSTLLEKSFGVTHTLFINLLDEDEIARFIRESNALYNIVQALPDHFTHVVIDEIQKVPKLLDTVQRLMKDSNKKFIMTGSSARKLKRGGANLLAGRAFVFHFFPFSSPQFGEKFHLDHTFHWGNLPKTLPCNSEFERQQLSLDGNF
ncbi:hypothetical protein BH10PSE19_BH10PSE19_17630 [soil metagenome]